MAGGERSGRVARPVGQAALAVPMVLYHLKKNITGWVVYTFMYI